MQSSRIRVGIIGVGGISYRHIKGFIESPDAEIVALVDTDPARLRAAIEKVPELAGVRKYSSYKDMLGAGGLDAVQINTPHTLHFSQIMDSLDAGLHVLSEKPMVCGIEDAHAVVCKAEESGKVMMIAYQRHFQPQYRYIKKMIEDGKLGEILSISALQCQHWKKVTEGTWRQSPSLSGGGQLNDSGSHVIDIILWATGLVADSVQAFIDYRSTAVDINSAITIKFTSGAQGTINIIGETPCRWYEDFTISGTKGVVFFRNGRLVHCNDDGDVCEPLDLPDEIDLDQGFCDAILGRDANAVPPECGLRVAELTAAAMKSAETGMPCRVEML